MIAGDRDERLHTLAEIVRWGKVEAEATERGEHHVARAAADRMREAVALLGFDPLVYDCGRDAAAVLIRKRSRELLNLLPGTSLEIGRAAGISAGDLPAYMRPFVERGEVRCTRTGSATYWEVVE